MSADFVGAFGTTDYWLEPLSWLSTESKTAADGTLVSDPDTVLRDNITADKTLVSGTYVCVHSHLPHLLTSANTETLHDCRQHHLACLRKYACTLQRTCPSRTCAAPGCAAHHYAHLPQLLTSANTETRHDCLQHYLACLCLRLCLCFLGRTYA